MKSGVSARLLLFVSLSLCMACSKTNFDKNDENFSEEVDALSSSGTSANAVPKEVEEQLETLSKKYFKTNEFVRKKWKDNQKRAYLDFINSVPDIPAKDYITIMAAAEIEHPDDYKLRKEYLDNQTNAYKKLTARKNDMKIKAYEFVIREVQKAYPNNFAEQSKIFDDWARVYETMESHSKTLDTQTLEKLKEATCKNAYGNANKALGYFQKEVNAKYKFENTPIPKSSKSEAKELREWCSKKHPNSYEAQMTELEMAISTLRTTSSLTVTEILNTRAEAVSNQKLRTPQSESEHNLADEIEKIFRENVFTIHGKENDLMLGVLTKWNGKNVIICSRGFVDKLPITLSNTKGTLTCSKAMISNDVPLIMLIPDSLPHSFNPIEIVNQEDSAKIFSTAMFAIGPNKNGIETAMVELFSEDNYYINLRTGYAPNAYHSTKVKMANRSGTQVLSQTVEFIPFGDNSIIIDPQSKKLVSFGIRIYNAGTIDHAGTGTVLGHERNQFPLLANIIRQFDSSVKTEKPFSSIRFTRLSNLETWTPFKIEELEKQGEILRKYTESNNDFLMFFKESSFVDVLKSRRLGRIAEQFRNDLLYKNLSATAYESRYRQYMLAVLFAMKREMMQTPSSDKFLSVYRNEIQYQIAIREAMFTYLSDAIKDFDIQNIIHVDLKSRYLNARDKSK